MVFSNNNSKILQFLFLLCKETSRKKLSFSDLFSSEEIVSSSIFIFNMFHNYTILNQGLNVQIYYMRYYILCMKTGSFFIIQ